MGAKYVFGMGTGRCGTVSLARMLSQVPGSTISHELVLDGEPVAPLLPWEKDLSALDAALGAIDKSGGSIRGDVASFWLPYASDLIERLNGSVRVVVLWRDRSEVIRSFEEKAGVTNSWVSHRGILWKPSRYDVMFPKFGHMSRADAIGAYWDLYHRMTEDLLSAYPGHVKMMYYKEALDASRFSELCSFLDIPETTVRPIHANSVRRKQSVARQWLSWRSSQLKGLVRGIARAWMSTDGRRS